MLLDVMDYVTWQAGRTFMKHVTTLFLYFILALIFHSLIVNGYHWQNRQMAYVSDDRCVWMFMTQCSTRGKQLICPSLVRSRWTSTSPMRDEKCSLSSVSKYSCVHKPPSQELSLFGVSVRLSFIQHDCMFFRICLFTWLRDSNTTMSWWKLLGSIKH